MCEIYLNQFENLFSFLEQFFVVTRDQFSIFFNHSLQPIHQYPILREKTSYIFIGIVLFVIFLLYVSVKVIEEKKLIKVFSSLLSVQAANQLLREDYKLSKRISVFLSIGFILVIAFLLFKANQYFNVILVNSEEIPQYLFFVITLLLMYTVKFLVMKWICYITLSGEIEKKYTFNVLIFSHSVGIILFPIIVCLQFSKYPIPLFLYPGLIIYCFFYILRLSREFVSLAFEQNIGIFYIFLYFWALEIMPLLILIKFLLLNF